jgi:hypothetical protein
METLKGASERERLNYKRQSTIVQDMTSGSFAAYQPEYISLCYLMMVCFLLSVFTKIRYLLQSTHH